MSLRRYLPPLSCSLLLLLNLLFASSACRVETENQCFVQMNPCRNRRTSWPNRQTAHHIAASSCSAASTGRCTMHTICPMLAQRTNRRLATSTRQPSRHFRMFMAYAGSQVARAVKHIRLRFASPLVPRTSAVFTLKVRPFSVELRGKSKTCTPGAAFRAQVKSGRALVLSGGTRLASHCLGGEGKW